MKNTLVITVNGYIRPEGASNMKALHRIVCSYIPFCSSPEIIPVSTKKKADHKFSYAALVKFIREGQEKDKTHLLDVVWSDNKISVYNIKVSPK